MESASKINDKQNSLEQIYQSKIKKTKSDDNSSGGTDNLHLHSNDIVRVKILAKISKDFYLVELPTGKHNVKIVGDYFKDDIVFFKLIKEQANIELRAYSSYTKSGRVRYSNNEIRRILNLPDNEIIDDVLTVSKEMHSLITREDILKTCENLNEIDQIVKEQFEKNNLIRSTILIKTQIGTSDSKIISKLLYSYIPVANLNIIFNKLLPNLKNYDTQSRYLIETFCKIVSQKNTYSDIYKMLLDDKFVSYKKFASNLAKQNLEANDDLAILSKVLDSMLHWNIYASAFKLSGTSYLVRFKQDQIFLRKYKMPNKASSKNVNEQRYTIIVETQNFAKVYVVIIEDLQNFRLIIEAKDAKTKSLLESNKEELFNQIKKRYSNLHHIEFGIREEIQVDSSEENIMKKNEHFTIVL